MNARHRDALRAQLEATIAAAEAAIAVLDLSEPAAPRCADGVHPESQVEDAGSLGEDLYRCRACGAESPTPLITHSED